MPKNFNFVNYSNKYKEPEGIVIRCDGANCRGTLTINRTDQTYEQIQRRIEAAGWLIDPTQGRSNYHFCREHQAQRPKYDKAV